MKLVKSLLIVIRTWGFNNGLYDLKEMVFRPRKKDDYISMTVGYDFKESSNVYRDEIMKFFSDIIPNPENRHFLLKTLSSTLLGKNREERLAIFTDAGKNDLWSKIYLLIFPITFVDSEREIKDPSIEKLKDPTLKEKITLWKEEFMCILIEYYKKYIEEGVDYTPDIINMIQKEKRENDSIKDYIDSYLERNDNGVLKRCFIENLSTTWFKKF
ncbi:hypothetical protein DFJ73DRAFT_763447 [Zopfochytrium polystomum]|nr:hypothetical protein DFJ73DRAFT_763447 [Zopfochytrium polystomum]